MQRKKIFLETNGCLSRSLDLKRLNHYFLKNNCTLVHSPDKADHILFLGCASIKQEENWSLKRIDQLDQKKASLIIGGCVKDISGRNFPSQFRTQSISSKTIENIDQFFPEFEYKFHTILDANQGMRRNLMHYLKNNFLNIKEFKMCYFRKLLQYYHTRKRKIFIIRIANGCEDQHCSYCSIWKAIGGYKSKSIDACLKELKIAEKNNIRHINLVADNLGAYGIDTNHTLPTLLNAMIAQYPKIQFLLEELSPKWLLKYKDDIDQLIEKKKIVSLHIPLQSGSERILGLMNRRYTAKQVYDSLQGIKKLFPKLKLYTDIIVGFPTETDEEFEMSLKILKNMKFDSIAYYPYDGNTNALKLKEIPEKIIKERITQLTSFLWKNKIGGGPF